MERIKGWVAAVRIYLREVLGELNKVTWPSRERVVKLTGVVVGMVALVAAFLYLIDVPLAFAMQELFNR